MDNLEKLEEALKSKNRTKDDIINYLLASKNQMKIESEQFVKTAKFQEIRNKLKALNKNNGL